MTQSPVVVGVAADTEHNIPLTRRECREIVTPYAFTVAPDLLGTVLATPLRRAVAMTIDGVLISLLASASLWVILPFMFYLAWLRAQLKKWGQVAVLLLLGFSLSASIHWAPEYWQEDKVSVSTGSDATKFDLVGAAVLTKTALALNESSCEQACIDEHLSDAVTQLQEQNIPKPQAEEVLTELLQMTSLTAIKQQHLQTQLLAGYEAKVSAVPSQSQMESAKSPATSAPEPQKKSWYLPDQDTHSLIAWVKGILADFGFGFGWAVFYFTLLIGWSHGQTIGKKVMGIKVIQLDGQELTLWGAFSRQGGYGAGFATGLMGFLQVFWDPNRQAIQDKVSATVVIRLGQPKRPLHH
jgi:hypothetical protein